MKNWKYLKRSEKGNGPENGDIVNVLENKFGTLYYVIDALSSCTNPRESALELNNYYNVIFNNCKVSNETTLYEFLRFGHIGLTNEKYSRKCCIAGVFITTEAVYVFNAGDVRVYGITKYIIAALTKDDSVVQQLIDKGEIKEEDTLFHSQKSFITQCLGGKDEPMFHIERLTKLPDAFLILSDGIHGCFLQRHFEYMLNESKSEEEFFNLLFDRSNVIDNSDDRTGVLIS